MCISIRPVTTYQHTFIADIVDATELCLADVVQHADLSSAGYDTATVIQLTDDEVTLFRPYVHTADFASMGRVISYIGSETYKVPRTTARRFYIYNRKSLG